MILAIVLVDRLQGELPTGTRPNILLIMADDPGKKERISGQLVHKWTNSWDDCWISSMPWVLLKRHSSFLPATTARRIKTKRNDKSLTDEQKRPLKLR